MRAVTWESRLEAAIDVHDVVTIAKDFVATLEHWELARIPDECRPGKFFDADDVTTYAFTLARNNCGQDTDAITPTKRLADFFASAAIRLSQILTANTAADNDSRQSA